MLLVLVASPFCTAQLSAQAGTAKPGDLSLEDLLNLPVSSASKYAQKSADAPGSITILTAEEIRRYGFKNLAEALRSLSSFSIATDHSYTYTGVRGFGRPADYNNRVLILIDGHTKNEAIIGAGEIGSLRMLDISDVSRVEVVRGPGSALYGAHAMLAVVNVITKTGSEIDAARVWGEIGSFGNRSYGLQFGREFKNGLNLAVSGGFAEAAGEDFFFPEFNSPQTSDGIAEGLNWGEVIRARVSAQYGGMNFRSVVYSRSRGIPTAPFSAVFGHPDAETDDNRWMTEAEYRRDFDTSISLAVRAYADHFETLHDYPHPHENLIDLKMGATWMGSEGRIRWDVRPEHRLVIGTEVLWAPKAEITMDDRYEQAHFYGDFPYSITSVFIQDEFNFSRNASLTVGLRHDEVSSTGGSTTPRFALVYHPWESTTIKALWGTAFRVPSLYEAHFESAYAVHMANPDLKTEEIQSSEIVFEQRLSKGLAARLGVFRYDFDNLVDQRARAWPDGWEVSGNPSPFVLQFQNGEMIRAQGAEFELNASLQSGTMAYLRLGLQRVEERSSGVEAPNYPTQSVKMGGTAWLGELVSLGGHFLWESPRNTLAGPETPSYSILDLTASTKVLFDHLTLSLSAKNLLDKEYSLPSGPQHSLISIPQPSRNLSFRLGVNW